MAGERLHEFDLRLCRHVLENIGSHVRDAAFAAFTQEWLASPVWEYLKALSDLDGPEPPALLLAVEDLAELEDVFLSGPFKFDRSWVSHPPL